MSLATKTRRRNSQLAPQHSPANRHETASGTQAVPQPSKSKRAFDFLGPYRPTVQILAIVVATFTALRIGLFAWFAETETLTAVQITRIFFLGFRFDLLVGLCFVMPQTLHITFFRNRTLATNRFSRWSFYGGTMLAFLILPFLCIAEALFFDEFESRFNYITFEYLVYPTEVCCNIWQSYPIVPLVASVLAAAGGLFFGLRRRFLSQFGDRISLRRRLGIFVVFLTMIAGLWRTTDMRVTKISENRVANELACNGWYSFVYYAWTCRFDYKDFYITIDENVAFDRVRNRIIEPTDIRHDGSSNPFDRTVHSPIPRRDWNVVIVLEESLGSDFIGVLGDGRKLTPEIDKLSKEALLFDNFYATGNRTARAMEAVLASFPPIPTESILKRDHSQRVFTLATALERRGYNRLFMTGGTGMFDGVRSFMTANGFNRFLEEDDYDDAVFSNAWGVADEDLFRRALTEFDKLHAEGKPFFSVVLTVSNHRPFTFPEGRIDSPQGRRDYAVKYADWALGDFFRKAKSHDFYRNTLFVVMGDHGARVYGAQLFPIKSYRVPVLMLLPEGQRAGERCHTLASSLDIAPTIMGLLGGSYRSVFLGRDALNIKPESGYAVMQHNHDLALLDAKNRMTVLGARRSATGFLLDKSTWDLQRLRSPDPILLEETVGFFQSGDTLYYSDRWFPD